MNKVISVQELYEFRDSVKARLPIDKYNLDDECMKQPAFYSEVSNMVPRAKATYRSAKILLEHIEAELEGNVRESPESYNIGAKPTRDAVSACIKRQDSYYDAQKAMIDAQYISDALEQLLEQVAQRKSMIRDLVRLYEKEYQQYQQMSSMQGDSRRLADSQAESIEKTSPRRERTRRRPDESED